MREENILKLQEWLKIDIEDVNEAVEYFKNYFNLDSYSDESEILGNHSKMQTFCQTWDENKQAESKQIAGRGECTEKIEERIRTNEDNSHDPVLRDITRDTRKKVLNDNNLQVVLEIAPLEDGKESFGAQIEALIKTSELKSKYAFNLLSNVYAGDSQILSDKDYSVTEQLKVQYTKSTRKNLHHAWNKYSIIKNRSKNSRLTQKDSTIVEELIECISSVGSLVYLLNTMKLSLEKKDIKSIEEIAKGMFQVVAEEKNKSLNQELHSQFWEMHSSILNQQKEVIRSMEQRYLKELVYKAQDLNKETDYQIVIENIKETDSNIDEIFRMISRHNVLAHILNKGSHAITPNYLFEHHPNTSPLSEILRKIGKTRDKQVTKLNPITDIYQSKAQGGNTPCLNILAVCDGELLAELKNNQSYDDNIEEQIYSSFNVPNAANVNDDVGKEYIKQRRNLNEESLPEDGVSQAQQKLEFFGYIDEENGAGGGCDFTAEQDNNTLNKQDQLNKSENKKSIEATMYDFFFRYCCCTSRKNGEANTDRIINEPKLSYIGYITKELEITSEGEFTLVENDKVRSLTISNGKLKEISYTQNYPIKNFEFIETISSLASDQLSITDDANTKTEGVRLYRESNHITSGIDSRIYSAGDYSYAVRNNQILKAITSETVEDVCKISSKDYGEDNKPGSIGITEWLTVKVKAADDVLGNYIFKYLGTSRYQEMQDLASKYGITTTVGENNDNELNSAYRKIALVTHPDKHNGDTSKERDFLKAQKLLTIDNSTDSKEVLYSNWASHVDRAYQVINSLNLVTDGMRLIRKPSQDNFWKFGVDIGYMLEKTMDYNIGMKYIVPTKMIYQLYEGQYSEVMKSGLFMAGYMLPEVVMTTCPAIGITLKSSIVVKAFYDVGNDLYNETNDFLGSNELNMPLAAAGEHSDN